MKNTLVVLLLSLVLLKGSTLKAEGFLPSGSIQVSSQNTQTETHLTTPKIHTKQEKIPHKLKPVLNTSLKEKPQKSANNTLASGDAVDQIINSEQGQQLYKIEVNLSIQKKKNELLKLKEDAVKMESDIEKTQNPQPVPSTLYQYPTTEKGFYAPAIGVEGTSILKDDKQQKFQVAMVVENKKALLKTENGFLFIKIGDQYNDSQVESISQSGITLSKDGVKTFYPMSLVIMPVATPLSKVMETKQ